MLGPMLAREMGIATTVIPQVPAAFSAFGMLMTDLQHEFSATILRPLTGETLSQLGPAVDEFTGRGHAALLAQGVKEGDRYFTRSIDVRYRGQEHALAIELSDADTAHDAARRFHELHQARHGHAMPEPTEILTLRVRATGRLPKPALRPIARADRAARPSGSRTAFDVAAGRLTAFPVYQRRDLLAGHQLSGPAIVEEGTATAVLFGDQQLRVDDFGQLLITSAAAPREAGR
jgi:N-methylhydantoinase A